MVSRVTVANCLNLRGLVLGFYRDSNADFNQGETDARCCSILLVSTSLFLGWMMTGSILLCLRTTDRLAFFFKSSGFLSRQRRRGFFPRLHRLLGHKHLKGNSALRMRISFPILVLGDILLILHIYLENAFFLFTQQIR